METIDHCEYLSLLSLILSEQKFTLNILLLALNFLLIASTHSIALNAKHDNKRIPVKFPIFTMLEHIHLIGDKYRTFF